jgi:hypothetical protein
MINKTNKKMSREGETMQTRVKHWESMILQLSQLCLDNDDHYNLLKPETHLYTQQFDRLLLHNGQPYVIKYMKAARNAVYKYVSKNSLTNVENVKLTHDGIPTFLQGWIPLLRARNKRAIQVVISLLSIGRLFTSVGTLRTDTITSPYTGKDTTEVISDLVIESFVKEHNLFVGETDIEDPSFYIRSSTGPSGPAMASVVKEAKDMQPDLYDLVSYFLTDITKEVLDKCREPNVTNHPNLEKLCSNSSMRKITVVEDKEGKDRVIAIFDYWSQLCLKPLHHSLMSRIRSLDRDATYDQAKVKRTMINNQGPFYSLDLSSATDRMPAVLQQRLLSKMLGNEERAMKYMQLLNSTPFDIKGNDTKISYSVGQPMGAYSSWALMALCHHLIVYSSLVKGDDYILLGDDLVISGHSSSKLYKEKVHDLGMEINLSKTIESMDSFEFAKRFFIQGQELSPLPIGSLKHATTHYWDIVGFIDQCEDRG